MGRPYAYDRRVVLQAIAYVMQTGCAWHTLPSRFPPWQTVYAQLARWRKTGIWDTIWAELDKPQPTDELQL
jgi:transposase